MSGLEPDCPNCKVRMERGFLLDHGHHNSVQASDWIEGIPEKSFWSGLKIKDREKHTVTSFRCPRCGLLREYAL